MPTVWLIGTLDTKGDELQYVRALIRSQGFEVFVIDAGSVGAPTLPLTSAATTSSSALGPQPRKSAHEAIVATRSNAAARGVAGLVAELARQGRVDGILAIGGSAGTHIGTAAMRVLPFGVPKVMVSTLASGQTRPFVQGSDIVMVHPVADLAGLNRLTRTALANAANALAGMVRGQRTREAGGFERPVVAATMFGVTTPCVEHARRILDGAGYEVLVFHATGIGGQAMEGLVRDGQIAGVLDLTTTELADELVGGILSAGPDRLEAAGRRGIPQVVSVGALDMVNFGPATIPERFAGRRFHQHNPAVTLMRTTAEENAAIGARMAEILARARGPVTVMIPRGGVSALDVPGQPFHDPEADRALFGALENGLASGARIEIVVRDEPINHPAFAEAAARALIAMLEVDRGK